MIRLCSCQATGAANAWLPLSLGTDPPRDAPDNLLLFRHICLHTYCIASAMAPHGNQSIILANGTSFLDLRVCGQEKLDVSM